MLWLLPPELAQVLRAFLTLADVVVLVGSASPSCSSTRLHHFLPSVDELDGYVANTKSQLKSERRKRPTRVTCDGAVSGYDDACALQLLLRHDCYAGLAQCKLDATEALQRGLSSVALRILEAQRQRRQLNRFSVTNTLTLALRRSDHAVVEWILEEETDRLPRTKLVDVALACCEYQDQKGNSSDRFTELLWSLLSRASDRDQRTLLVAAARSGKRAIVEHLLSLIKHQTGSHDLIVSVLEDALAAAAEGGDVEVLRALMSAVSTLPTPVSLNATAALVKAAETGRVHIVTTLLTASQLSFPSSAQHLSGSSESPLLAAVKSGSCKVLHVLLRDQRVNEWDPRAFQHAACCGQLGMVQDLLQHPACRPKDLELALRAAATARSPQLLDKATNVLLGLLTRLQVDAGSSWELLDLVCSYGNVELIELLLAKFPSSEQCSDRKYWRPLVTAARHGHAEVVRLILQAEGVWTLLSIHQSLDVESELAEALLAACHRGHLETAKKLLSHVSLEMMQLLRIVEAAAAASTCTVLEWLLGTEMIASTWHGTAAGYDLDAALQYACAHGRTAAVRLLLAHPHVHFASGLPIQFAATSGELDLVDLLLADARITAAYDLEGALIDASREGHIHVVARLLEDSRLRITSGAAYHEAAHYGRREVLEMLLRHTDVDLASLDLEAAYTRAVQRGHYAIVFLLLNDPRVRLPVDGAITRVEDLPKRQGDSTWCRRFLRRFFRHPRVDPTAENHQLLLDACLHARLGIVDALLRSGRVSVTETLVETVEALALLAQQSGRPREGHVTQHQRRRERRYTALAASLRQYRASRDKPRGLVIGRETD